MKVLINGKVYDANETPIILLLSDQDKANIQGMVKEATLYICYPEYIGFKESLEHLVPHQPPEAYQEPRELLKKVFNV